MVIHEHKKPKIHKQVMAKYLYNLNHHITLLRQQAQKTGDNDEKHRLNDEIERLYNLKNRVLTKMVKEGFAKIKDINRAKNKDLCTVRINRETTFHIPITEEIMELLRGMHGEEEKEANIRVEDAQDDTSAHTQEV